MEETSHGTGGLTFDKSKRSWPNEMNILLALIIIIVIFEILGQALPYMKDQSFLFDSRDRFDSIFNEANATEFIAVVDAILKDMADLGGTGSLFKIDSLNQLSPFGLDKYEDHFRWLDGPRRGYHLHFGVARSNN